MANNKNSDKFRILILQSYMAPYRIDIYNSLSELFNIKVLYWFLTCPDQKFDDEQLKSKIRYKFDYLRFGFIIKNRSKSIFRVFKFDIFVHLFTFRPNLFIAHEFGFFTILALLFQKVFNYKVIISCDDSADMVRHQSGFKQNLKRLSFKFSDGLIVVNYIVKQEYSQRGFHAEKIIVNPIMHDDRNFRESLIHALPVSTELVDKFELENKKVILFVGRLIHVKGLDLLLHSFAKLSASDDSLKLVLVGHGTELTALKNLTNELNISERVLFVGRCDGLELMAWYNIGSLFVLPSRFEPFGAVINEALISGMPAICTSIAGASFLINEENGKIFESENLDALVDAINFFVSKVNPINTIEVRKSLLPVSYSQNIKQLAEFFNHLK